MPRYISIRTLKPALRSKVLDIKTIHEPNPLFRNPTPTDELLKLSDAGKLPSNIRVQTWVDNRQRWEGVSVLERYGGRPTKDWGKSWREGRGREARRLGGLVSALRER